MNLVARATEVATSMALRIEIIIFLASQLVAVHLPELRVVQRLKHVADQIPLSSSFQILATDPCFGCIFSTPQCQALRLVLTMSAPRS